MSDLREEETPVGSNVPNRQEPTSTPSLASGPHHEVAPAVSSMPSTQEQGSSTLNNLLDNQDKITSAMELLELDSLTPTITVVEVLLLSELKVSVKDIIGALQLIEALVDQVSSNQTPPFLKVIDHNVDTNAFAKLSKGKKGSSSVGRGDSPEKITPHAACARCQHDPAVTQPALTLRSCLNCEAVEYCSVACQLTDWMAHRNLFCVNPTAIPPATLAKPHRVPFLKTHISNPFARLAKGIWLHDRHKQDVYALLIDSFRLREADDFNYGGMTNNDSVYSSRVSSCPAFRRFLYQAEAKGLMPPWWSDQKRVECLTKGIDKRQDNYHDLHAMTRDIEIVVVYEDAIMTMQLRMFAESVLGKGAAGSDGRLMLQKMVVAEEAARVLSK